MIKQAVQDPTGTALGAVEVASLASPIANAYRAYNLLSGGDFSVTGAGMEDVEQFAELASLIPSGKVVGAPFKAGVNLLDVGIKGAARRTTPDALRAASGGIISGAPKSLARRTSNAGDKVETPDDFETNLLRNFEETKVSPRYTSPEVEARLLEEAKISTPRNIDALLPRQISQSGDWDTVEIAAQDELSGLTKLDPSEVRLLAFGGRGDLAKDTPLAGLGNLKVPENATTIRAIYAPPTADEVLAMMKKTDAGVQSRSNVEPDTWVRNTYTIEDAQALLDRWKTASTAFEKTNGRPLPWRLEADVPDPETGVIKTKRIFGQDVEHAIPVNQGGTGAAEELVLLPSIPNMGKGDLTWEAYAGKYPDEWASLVKSFYGDVKKY
jgi:hypothetical protein